MKRSAESYKDRWKTAATLHSVHPTAFLFGQAQILQSLTRIRKVTDYPSRLTNCDFPMAENPGKRISSQRLVLA